MWGGVPPPELISRLIELAIERQVQRQIDDPRP
jgi:hypothetical protein